MPNFTDFLKAEAARAQEATRHDSEVIEHALTTFKWIVGVVGALVLAGASAAGWMMAAWNRTTITGIFQREIKAQVEARFREVDSEIRRTLTRVVGLTDELSKQQDTIAKLITMTTGVFPYVYLKAKRFQTGAGLFVPPQSMSVAKMSRHPCGCGWKSPHECDMRLRGRGGSILPERDQKPAGLGNGQLFPGSVRAAVRLLLLSLVGLLSVTTEAPRALTLSPWPKRCSPTAWAE